MAVQPYPYLVMTDGTDTVTFADGAGGLTNWMPVRGQWAPAIAGVRASQLGGRGPYADIEEDLSCNIRNTTAALVYQNLDTLARLLDKAERWWLRNENISPVLLKYVPQGSTLHNHTTNPLQAIVLGRAGTDEKDGVLLPPDANDAGMLFEIDNVKVICMRRGLWCADQESPGATATQANPNVITRSFTNNPSIPSPVSILSFTGFDASTTPTLQAGFIAVGSQSTDIQIFEAEALAASTFTSVADAANNARGGSVLRCTPVDTNPKTTGLATLSGSGLQRQIAVLAAVRNNSGSTTWQIQANLSGFGATASTPVQQIDTSSAQPRLLLLGVVTIGLANKLSLTITASAASGTLDIDYIAVVNLRDETTRVIAHDSASLSSLSAGAAFLRASFDPLTDQAPSLVVNGPGGNVPVAYRGDLALQSTGQNLYAAWFSTNGASWRFTTTAPAVLSNGISVTRYSGYLSPQ